MFVFLWMQTAPDAHESRTNAPRLNLSDYRSVEDGVYMVGGDMIAPSWSPRVLRYFYDRIFRYNAGYGQLILRYCCVCLIYFMFYLHGAFSLTIRLRPHVIMLSRGGMNLIGSLEALMSTPREDAESANATKGVPALPTGLRSKFRAPLGNTGSDPPAQLAYRNPAASLQNIVFIFIDGEAHDFADIAGRPGERYGGKNNRGGLSNKEGSEFSGEEMNARLFYWGRGLMPQAGKSVFLPFFVTSFIERWDYSPALLAREGEFKPRR
jgi:hypothetical protein